MLNHDFVDTAKARLSKLDPRRKKSSKTKKLPSTWHLFKRAGYLWQLLKKQTAAMMSIHIALIYVFDAPTSGQQFGIVSFIGVVMAMAYIWLARQTDQDKPQLAVKSALYRGPAQIVPFILLLVLIGIQSLPFSIGGLIYQIGVNSSPPIAIYYWEKLLFAGGWVLLTIPTLYWLLPTLLGLLVVALPNVSPLQARRAAQQLVEGKLFKIWLKSLWLILGYGLVLGSIVVALVTWLPQVTAYLLTYSGVVLLPVGVYQLFGMYQVLREN